MSPFQTSFGWALQSMSAKPAQREVELPKVVVPSISFSSSIVAAAAAEPGKIVPYTNAFYGVCALGGIASCGLTHTAVTPMDVVKCNMQTNAAKFTGIGTGFKIIIAEQGVAGLFRGWAPTLVGYSAQGAFKFGLYEYITMWVFA